MGFRLEFKMEAVKREGESETMDGWEWDSDVSGGLMPRGIKARPTRARADLWWFDNPGCQPPTIHALQHRYCFNPLSHSPRTR